MADEDDVRCDQARPLAPGGRCMQGSAHSARGRRCHERPTIWAPTSVQAMEAIHRPHPLDRAIYFYSAFEDMVMYRPRNVFRTIIAVLIIILLATTIIGLVVSWPNWINVTSSKETWTFPGVLIGLLIFVIVLGILFRIVFGLIFGPLHYHRYRRWYGGGPWGQDAHDILDQRYARGEITKEQYDQMSKDLMRNRQGP